ncbi:TPA: hypothetical protein PIU42_000144 [Klebsiella quasipneumoniae subsp. similipneumoniae]|nr:hypothetical protein [Klebsiella quasipneumoniae subsp. similipneumoniae]
MERGVVAIPAILNKMADGFSTQRGILPEEINYYALYWDYISIPTNNFINFGVWMENDLIDCGILNRPQFRVSHMNSAEYPRFHIESQFKTLDMLRKDRSDIDWRIHQISDEVLMPKSSTSIMSTSDSVRLSLDRLLPVPSREVHICDILEFKLRRKPELMALHAYCDDLYLEVVNSADQNLLHAKNFEKLKLAIEDLDKVSSEGWQFPIKFNLDISPEFDISQSRAGIATILLALNSPNPAETIGTGAVISVLEGFVKIKAEIRSFRKPSRENNDFIYLSNAIKEKIIKR